MSEDIKPDVIKKTQESLGKFIKKPTLTEKLLKKPPFRFLHDICTSVARETGFFEGVLNQDDQFENIKDKEGKILFLQKVIAAVESAGGVKLTVKPNKVVAGLEATKTNEFLQALGKVLEKQQLQKKSSKTVISVKPKSIKKGGKEVKEEPPDKKKSSGRTQKKAAENGQNQIGDNKKKPDLMTVDSPENKVSNEKEGQQVASRENEVNWVGGSLKNKYVYNDCLEQTEQDIYGKSSAIGARESNDMPDIGIIRVNGVVGQGDWNHATKERFTQNGESREIHMGKQKHQWSSLYIVPDQTKETDKNLKETQEVDENTSNNNLWNKSESQNKTARNTLNQLNTFKKDIDLVRENTLISRPRTAIQPPTARPASARPAAPRIRVCRDVPVSEEIMKPASGKVHVIVDEEALDEIEEEALISLEATNDAAAEETPSVLSTEIHITDYEHGHLVEQILETQKELEDDSKFSQQKLTSNTEIEWELGKNRESANQEIEKLRGNIQTLTRTANPLGKLLDFFQEDFEMVQKELESWRDKNASYCLKIKQEKIVTEQYLEPLKIYLKEVQKNIDEQLDQISLVKAHIIRNNEKITKLFSGI